VCVLDEVPVSALYFVVRLFVLEVLVVPVYCGQHYPSPTFSVVHAIRRPRFLPSLELKNILSLNVFCCLILLQHLFYY
jgi:hypothetical protein